MNLYGNPCTFGSFYRNVLMSFFYSLAFLLSIQVQEPVWQEITGSNHTFIGAQVINLLPVQEHSTKQTSVPVYPFPVIIFQGSGTFSKLFLKIPASNSLMFSDKPGLSCFLGCVSILLPILRI
ncbi:MAG: hypothetical protein FD166_2672 [Bacteroidetes bacterium]|nr:MAG: hypothetical protein FD166_2672 [Bacteroidota bacterium]